MNVFSKGGVYDAEQTGEAFCEQRADLWSRWKAGQSLHEIGRAFGKSHVVIQFLLARHGGIAPAPADVRCEHLPWPNGKTSPAGSRTGDGPTQELHGRYERESLLL